MKANFTVPFDPITRQTILPTDADGQPIPMDMWHITPESGKTVCVQVRGDDAVIEAMKLPGSGYQWLEDKIEVTEEFPEKPPIDGDEKVIDEKVIEAIIKTSPVEAKVFVLSDSTSFTKTAVDKLVWETPEDAIESIVKLHGSTLDAYKGSGLGQELEVGL